MTVNDSSHLRRTRYLDRIGRQATRDDLTDALQRAHDLRRFEIENYWRRSTYFWGFQLAAAAAIAIVWQDNRLDPLVLMVVAIVGIATAYAAVLTAQGSKFWQRNWEAHVDLLEDEIEGRLHKTVLVRDRELAPSVSQVNDRLLWILTIGWALAFVTGATLFANIDPNAAFSWQKATAVGILTVAFVGALFWLKRTPRSAIEDRAVDWQTMEPIHPTTRTG